jgi:uncharacterized protein (TIGR01777 family)
VIRTNGVEYAGDLLIACDGIHSKIRNCLMSELHRPPINETPLNYTYFRANTQLPEGSSCNWWTNSFEIWGKHKSTSLGNYALRFGYVPLKPPTVFWFIAIETQKNHPYLSPIKSVQIVDKDTKNFLLRLIQSWNPIRNEAQDIVVNYEELINYTDQILRTDIAKITGTEQFPWTSKDKRVVIMGDAAHAIAPNLAQGAGLCIEDAACLVSQLNRIDYLHGIVSYEQERKPRVKTVQKLADCIATMGQLKNPILRALRTLIMRSGVLLMPTLQQKIFEYFVSLSLGGSRKAIYWQLPKGLLKDDVSSIFARVFSNYLFLEDHIKEFKISRTAADGLGVVTVKKAKYLRTILGLLGLPKDMAEQPFYAEVINLSSDIQCWRRIFGYKTPLQKTYTTKHSLYCDFQRQIYLSESFGGFLDRMFQFIYKVKLLDDNSLIYQSAGIVFFNLFKIPLPLCVLPKSVWQEKPTEQGWLFEGSITLPLLGTVFHYYGRFGINQPQLISNRIIIAGGSGMIGREVCLTFIKKGYEVYCLSRFLNKKIDIEGVKVRVLEEDWSDLIDKNTIIINLSGANPGAKRWSSSFKLKIAESRYHVIDIIDQNIARAKQKPLKYLQASAAGYYGDAGDELVTENSKPSISGEKGTRFRVDVCREIEKRANNVQCNVINLRIGHVLANQGGVLPYFRLASLFFIGKLGSGNQYIPFVHINDLTQAIDFIAGSKELIKGAINITAPTPCKNSELLKELGWFTCIPGLTLSKFFLKLLIGEAHVVLTDSERVLPKRLLAQGFNFNYKTIKEALNGLR